MTNITRSCSLITASVFAGLLWVLPIASVESAEPSEQRGAAPDPMQFARGAKAWSENCGRCHNLRDPKELRDDQWRAASMHMRVRGNLTGQDTRDILAFLQGSN